MVGIKCPASQQVSFEERYSTETTLEGRVKAQARPVGRRVWQGSLSEASTPADHAKLLAFIQGAWGAGPFVFVSADAPLVNMLTPADSLCQDPFPGATNIYPGGPVQLDDGSWASASWASDGTGSVNFNYQMSPVTPGQVITGSAWVKGLGASARIYFYDANGNFLTVTGPVSTGTALSYTRAVITATVPTGAVGARVGVTSSVGATRPALTWTSTVQPWGVGEGCVSAVVHAASKDLTLATLGSVYSSLSFTVTEVG
ncbi:hypothetical protein [Glutamicibacter sp. FBE19]|uniref:hypothetical protein n=1 Tax=Glutamicibacter sp. FBE19 TaxID=2761534 RepID=UPI0018965103|nr:hypothetical protein [Glutamicibacter sp. FBE19]MBF6671604.1 hypothetical protein [Glutamicibacter sp. FBE19]